MALVRLFKPLEFGRHTRHGEVEARYAIYQTDGQRFIQINTYRRADGELSGKASQSIQLDKASAAQLVRILKEAFRLN